MKPDFFAFRHPKALGLPSQSSTFGVHCATDLVKILATCVGFMGFSEPTIQAQHKESNAHRGYLDLAWRSPTCTSLYGHLDPFSQRIYIPPIQDIAA